MCCRSLMTWGLSAALACGVLFCSPWPTAFEEIDDHRPRVLDFIYRNTADTTLSEAAPGDTVWLDVYCAGEPIRSIDWRVSYNVQVSANGSDTALAIQPLTPVYTSIPTIPDNGFTDRTIRRSLAFIIPRTIMVENEQIVKVVSTNADFVKINPVLLLGFIDSLSRLAPDRRQEFIDSNNALLAPRKIVIPSYDSLKTLFGPLLQFTNATVRIFATINGVHKVESNFVVRYNRRFTDVPGVFVNHNPRIRFVGVYKVKGNGKPTFKPGDLTEQDTAICLYLDSAARPDPAMLGQNWRITDTVCIDKGFTYYSVIDTGVFRGVSDLDSTTTLKVDSTGKGAVIGISQELLYVQWFYEYNDALGDTILVNDRLVMPLGDPIGQLLPPRNKQIQSVTLWGQSYDFVLGERNRPSGSALREVSLVFTYTPAYLASLTK
jgi:hypothetical protein